MTRREAIKLLKSEKTIVALNVQAYLAFLALKFEIGARDLSVRLADIEKGYAQEA